MAAIAPKPGRSAGLLACAVTISAAFAMLLHADSQREILDLFTTMLAALSDDNVAGFMSGFDHDMPEYDKLKSQIAALVQEADIASAIEPVKESGDDTHHSIDLDWFMTIRSGAENSATVQRRQVIHCELRKQQKHWRIVSISPLAFFAPAKFSPRTDP